MLFRPRLRLDSLKLRLFFEEVGAWASCWACREMNEKPHEEHRCERNWPSRRCCPYGLSTVSSNIGLGDVPTVRTRHACVCETTDAPSTHSTTKRAGLRVLCARRRTSLIWWSLTLRAKQVGAGAALDQGSKCLIFKCDLKRGRHVLVDGSGLSAQICWVAEKSPSSPLFAPLATVWCRPSFSAACWILRLSATVPRSATVGTQPYDGHALLKVA